MSHAKKRPSVKPPVFMRWAQQGETDELREKLAAAESRIAALEAEQARYGARIRDLQDRNTSLVQLSVASQLLSGSGDREDVLNAIEEIVVNMIGSEEIAILELLPNDERVRLARARGVDDDRFARAVDSIREALTTGQVVIPNGSEVTAVIPLKMDSTTFGAVCVFRLLEHKPALDALDHELIELLSRQGAVAIFSAAFRSTTPTVRPPAKDGAS
jgi:hypothetical protein